MAHPLFAASGLSVGLCPLCRSCLLILQSCRLPTQATTPTYDATHLRRAALYRRHIILGLGPGGGAPRGPSLGPAAVCERLHLCNGQGRRWRVPCRRARGHSRLLVSVRHPLASSSSSLT